MDLETNYANETAEVSLADNVRKMITDLDDLVEGTGSYTDAHFRVLARGLQLTLVALSSSMGECQILTPYSPLHPVLKPDGSRTWCCNHDPEHCS